MTMKKNPGKHFKYRVEYTTNNDNNYQLKDLTVRSLLDIAERIGREKLPKLDIGNRDEGQDDQRQSESVKESNKKESKTAMNHLWKIFVKRAFVQTKPDEEIDQEFG